MSMGESVILQDAWLLLKDFSFRRNLPEDYYNTLPERMIRHIESRRPLEHVDGRVHPHYANRKQERYNENQALPKEFNTRAAKKYKFTLEDIMMFMANDVVSQHPELKQVMNMRLPASDSRLPNRDPSMHFDAFQTSRPKATKHGLQHLVTPHFTINPRSKKLQLKTVGSGAMADRSRQTIHAKPTTSPIVNDNHDNAKIHESLPQRFDFMERKTPPGQAVETASPIQPDEPDDKYSHLSPPFAARMRELDAQRQSNSNDNVETGEPMDIAYQLLKNDDETPDYSDYPVDQCEMCDKHLHDSDYHVLNDHNFCSDCYNQLAEPKEFDPDFQSKLTGEPMDIALRLLKAKYLDENMNNVLYGEQDPVAQPVAEEPPHVHSIEGRTRAEELEYAQRLLARNIAYQQEETRGWGQDKLRREEARLRDKINEAEKRLPADAQYPAGDERTGYSVFPKNAIPADRVDDEFVPYSQRIKPQELNNEAREKFPLRFDENYKFTGEPMDIALRLLKENKLPNFCSSCQGAGCEECDNTGMHWTERFHQENEPMSVYDMENYSGERQLGYYGEEPNPMESFQDIIADTPVGRKKQTGIMGRTYRGKPTFNMIPLAGAGRSMINPHAEIFRRSETMDIAMRLLKEVVI